jgi:uncharacterized coiled-coil protein SlyX
MTKDQEDIYKELAEYNKIIVEYENNIKKSVELLRRFKEKFSNQN